MKTELFLRSKLVNDPGVAGLVGSRITPLLRPEGSALPAISYFRVSTVRKYNVNGDANLSFNRFQIDCWADTYAKSLELGNAVVTCLSGFYGTTTISGSSGYFGGIHVANEKSEYIEDINEYRYSIDVLFMFDE